MDLQTKHEQWRRLVERTADPDKYWKAPAGDLRERLHSPAFMAADEDVLRAEWERARGELRKS